MTIERRLKSYDDIAKYIVEQIRFNAVDNLPDEFFDSLGPYPSNFTYPMYGSGPYAPRIRLDWTPWNKTFTIVFLHADGSILHRILLQPATKEPTGEIKTFGSHDATGKEIE